MSRFGFAILPILLFALLLSTSNADEQRVNYGVVFQEQSDIDFATDYWTHVYEIQTYLNVQHMLINRCAHPTNYQCQSYNKIIAEVNFMRINMNSQIKETQILIDKLIPKLNSTLNGKSKRAILGFVGTVMGGLFDLVTTGSVNKLVAHINTLTTENNKIAKALTQYGGSLTSFVSQTEERLDNAMNGIQRNYNSLLFLNNQIKRDKQNFEQHFTSYFQIITDQSQDVSTLQNYVTDLKSSIINLLEGKISPLILIPQVIQQTVNDIQNILNVNYTGYKILTSSPHYYYNNAQFVVFRNNSKLYLAVQFPLTTHGKTFQTYKIKTFPVQVTTQLLDLPEYILMTHDRKHFTTLTFEQLNACKGFNPKHYSKSVYGVSQLDKGSPRAFFAVYSCVSKDSIMARNP
ncbi:uncharacterized protein LOC134719244 [Mytilus trossulus]|uniref:uncharacterized protein LOC134719244 n=1 Tax=Mytilus trossulus TaxID=6551 RepID=UPI0030066D7F